MVNGPLISCTAYLHICFHHFFFLLYFDRLIVYWFSSSTRIFHQMETPPRPVTKSKWSALMTLDQGIFFIGPCRCDTKHFIQRTAFRLVASYDKRWALIFFFCLEVWRFTSHSIIFHSFGVVSIAGEWLQILTYARHLWPLSSVSFLACQTYYDTGNPFIMLISEIPWHKPNPERLAVELSLTVLTTWVCGGLDSNTKPSAFWANALTHCATASVHGYWILILTRLFGWLIVKSFTGNISAI